MYCVITLCVFLFSHVYLFIHVYIPVLHNLDAGLLPRSQYSEGPATGHHDTGISWFPCVYKQTLRRIPTFQVATTCFSCSSPGLNLLDPYFIFMCMHNNHCHRVTAHFAVKYIIISIKFECYHD